MFDKSKITLIALFAIAFALSNGFCQILPRENSKLNYRIIGFKFDKEINTTHNFIEIAIGRYYSKDSFSRSVFKTVDATSNHLIVEVPKFGEEYTWRSVSVINHSRTRESALHHFSTLIVPYVDTSQIRLRVTEKAKSFGQSYVFIDGCKVLYDMSGKPVWFLPDRPEFDAQNSDQRDLKITPQGTITFLTISKALEIGYNGRVLWQAPNDGQVSHDTSEFYHHEFTRLSNGHYMIMGFENEPVYLRFQTVNGQLDSSLYIGKSPAGDQHYKLLYDSRMLGTVIEYDERGNAVWSYHTSKYFSGSDLINNLTLQGNINIKVHDNSFFFDESRKQLYISFRDINRIIKIKYPEGLTLNTYGRLFKPLSTKGGLIKRAIANPDYFFCGQHCCRCDRSGSLYLFDNNSCHPGGVPKIVVLEQPNKVNDTLKKIWEFQCPIENTACDTGKLNFFSGGNVEELPDGSYFASMGMGYGKVFIVNQNKGIMWSAVAEKWNSFKKCWEMIGIYRASIITDQALMEKLVWNGAESDK